MADNTTWAREQASRVREFYDVYTRGFSAEAFQRLFTRDTRDAYRYFSNAVDREALAVIPWWKRPAVFARGLFMAITMKMTPARRVLFALALASAVVGLVMMLDGFHTLWIPIDPIVLRIPLPAPSGPGNRVAALSIAGLALLIVLEVFERLSLKNDLEIARDIQQAMLPRGLYSSGGLEAFGATRAANTVGGDFYDILPRPDGRVVLALGDVAGKGSPAALLMAILLAMLRTLLDEGLDAVPLISRLNVQILRHAPSSRFITLQFVNLDPRPGISWRSTPAICPDSSAGATASSSASPTAALPSACSTPRSTPPSVRDSSRATSSCSTATASPRPKARPACLLMKTGSSPSSAPTETIRACPTSAGR